MTEPQQIWLLWGFALGLLTGALLGAIGGWGIEVLAALTVALYISLTELRNRRR